MYSRVEFVGCRGRIESLGHLARLLGQLAERRLAADVPADGAGQRHGCGRIGTRDVVRHLGEVAERRDVGIRDGQVEHGDGGRRHAQQAVGAGRDVAAQQPWP